MAIALNFRQFVSRHTGAKHQFALAAKPAMQCAPRFDIVPQASQVLTSKRLNCPRTLR